MLQDSCPHRQPAYAACCLKSMRRCSKRTSLSFIYKFCNMLGFLSRSRIFFSPQRDGRTDRQKEREQQSVSAYRWRVGAECSPAAPRLPAALSTSPADAGPPRSRSCPSTTGSPVENTAHLLKNTALLTLLLCSAGVTRACF